MDVTPYLITNDQYRIAVYEIFIENKQTYPTILKEDIVICVKNNVCMLKSLINNNYIHIQYIKILYKHYTEGVVT